jgi:3-hydroxy-9,10-secoandrosta-1,3,5(10)-triene-9,17-dione monooxygenase
VTHEEAVHRAQELAPRIRERALRAERERRVPIESIEEFVGAGLARILQPKRWGGYEISHDAACDVTLEISAACASTGWCCSFLNIHCWWLAAFSEEAQHDVWGNGPDVNIATSVSPHSGTATATVVDGGYRLSGRWPFSSGIDHCSWAIISGLPVIDGRPEFRIFVVPRSEMVIDDTWFNMGMRGTGSKDILIDDTFVPAHRSIPFADLREGTAIGRTINNGPIYTLPMRARNHELIAVALGAARGAYRDWVAWSRERISGFSGESVAHKPDVQIELAHAEIDLDAAELLLRRNLGLIRNGGPIDDDTRSRITSSGGRSMQMICGAIDALMRISGSRGTAEDNPIQRAWRDVHTVATHVSLNPTASGELRGRTVLGLPPEPEKVNSLTKNER